MAFGIFGVGFGLKFWDLENGRMIAVLNERDEGLSGRYHRQAWHFTQPNRRSPWSHRLEMRSEFWTSAPSNDDGFAQETNGGPS